MAPRDRFGLDLTTASETAAAHYRDGIELMLSAQPGADLKLRSALAADPDFAVAHAALARFHQMRGEAVPARAAAAEARRASQGIGDREGSHVDILASAAEGRGAEAYRLLRVHMERHPLDWVALSPAVGVFGLIAFSGRPDHHAEQRALLDGLAPYWPADWWFDTYRAWSHIETEALDAGVPLAERAFAANPANANAAHVVTHGRYEAEDLAAGAAFLADWLPGYARDGALHGHLAWHLALFELKLGEADAAWAIYRDAVAPDAARTAPLNRMTDAASFLWRASVDGHPASREDWAALTPLITQFFSNATVGFADVHVAMVLAALGDGQALERRVDAITAACAPTATLAVSLARAFDAMARDSASEAAEHLAAAQPEWGRLGGSHAQRDLFEESLIAACSMAGRPSPKLRNWTFPPEVSPLIRMGL